MTTGRSTKLTGAIGEFLVSAELCRRGLLATPFAGNVPYFDVVTTGASGGYVPVQVKTINGSTWQFKIGQFVAVKLDGKRQVLGKLAREPFPGLICVLVVLKAPSNDQFFVLPWKDLQKTLVRMYRAYLRKHQYIRPRAHASFHTALSINEIAPFRDQWQIIDQRIASSA